MRGASLLNVLRQRTGLLIGRRKAEPAVQIGLYKHDSWPRRHKWMLYLALLGFSVVYGFAFAILSGVLLVQLLGPILILLGLTLWVLPDTEAVPSKYLGGFLVAYLIGLLCWPDYVALDLPGLPWITAQRLTGIPLALVVVICLSMSGKFRARLIEVWCAEPVIARLAAAFFVIAFCSIWYSTQILFSLQRFAIAQLGYTFTFIAATYVFSRPGSATKLAKLLWGIAVYVCIIGLYETHFSKLPWAGRIPSIFAIDAANIERILGGISRAASGIYRVQSKFGISIGLGEYLAMALPFTLYLSIFREKTAGKLLGAATVLLVFYIVLKTDSRLAFISFLTSTILFLMFWTGLRWYRNKDSILAPLLILAIPFATISLLIGSFTWRRLDRIIWGYGASVNSTDARRIMFEMGIPKVLKRPWGYGMDRSAETLGYTAFDGSLTIDTYFLSALLDFGVVGFAVYFGMFAFGSYKAAKIGFGSKDPEIMLLIPTSIALFNFILSKMVYSQQENHPLAFIILGMMVGLSWQSTRNRAGSLAQDRSGASPSRAVGSAT